MDTETMGGPLVVEQSTNTDWWSDSVADLLVPARTPEPDLDPDRDLATAAALREYLASRAR